MLVNVGRAGQSDLAVVHETRRHVPLLLSDAAALTILACVRAASHLDGAMAEAGVLVGGSARLICEGKGNAPLHLFDSFETLQSSASAGSDLRERELRTHFGKVHGRLEDVRKLLSTYPEVHLHAGMFPRSAQSLEPGPISFVHIDLDLPDSTRDAIAYFYGRLMPGGIMVGDDYNDPDVRRTFRTFFEDREDTRIEYPWGQVLIIKRSPADAGSPGPHSKID